MQKSGGRGGLSLCSEDHIGNYHQDQSQSTEIPDHWMNCNDFMAVDYICLSLNQQYE